MRRLLSVAPAAAPAFVSVGVETPEKSQLNLVVHFITTFRTPRTKNSSPRQVITSGATALAWHGGRGRPDRRLLKLGKALVILPKRTVRQRGLR